MANIVLNPGFELGTTSPSNWITRAEPTATYVWETPGRDGTGHCVSVEMITRVLGQIADWRSSARFSVVANQTYTVSGWFRTLNITGVYGANIVLGWYDATDTWIQGSVATPYYIRGTTVWTFYNNPSAVAPVNAVYGRVLLRLHDATGKVWFDDISVTIPSAGQTLGSITILSGCAMYVGGACTLGISCKDTSGTAMTCPSLTWTSSNPAIATVTSSGVVSGISLGTCFITATSGTVTSNTVQTDVLPQCTPPVCDFTITQV